MDYPGGANVITRGLIRWRDGVNQRKRFEGTTLLALKTEDRGCQPRSAGSYKERRQFQGDEKGRK